MPLHDPNSREKASCKSRASSAHKTVRAALGRLRNYSSQTWTETKRRKVSYCLGVMSCLIVVFVITAATTGLDKVPSIFFRLGQSTVGEYDISLTPATWTGAQSVDYAKTRETLLSDTEFGSSALRYNAPRWEFSSVVAYSVKGCSLPFAYWPQNSTTEWMYGVGPNACGGAGACFSSHCPLYLSSNLIVLDTQREAEMGFGSSWPFGPIPQGECLVKSSVADSLGLSVGDYIVLTVPTHPALAGVFTEAGLYTPGITSPTWLRTTYVPVRVFGTFDGTYDKFSVDLESPIVMEYGSFLRSVTPHLNPLIAGRSNVSLVDLSKYAGKIYLNLPPPRLDVYSSSTYSDVQARVTHFASRVLYRIGYDQVEASLPLLNYMRSSRFFSLFLGLIINLIVAILSILSILLIYSLLMVNVETRTFEMGVLRMVGMGKQGLIELISVQALSYAIPAWVLGLVLAQVLMIYVARALTSLLGVEVDPTLTPYSIGMGTVLGLLIPFVSAVLPMRAALAQSLVEALDTSRSRVKAVVFSISRSEDHGVSWSVILVGFVAFIFGFAVYYGLPLSLLNFNLDLLLALFFALLLCMLLGLVLLSLNFENLTEFLICKIFLFWENLAVQSMVLKNLVAHRPRNRKTTIMYSLSLGFIIFISVTFTLQITSQEYQTRQRYGSRLLMYASNQASYADPAARAAIDSVLESHPGVEGHTWSTWPLATQPQPVQLAQASNPGRYKTAEPMVVGVQPNAFSVLDSQFLVVSKEHASGYSIDEQLYTTRGSHSAIVGSLYQTLLGLTSSDTPFLLRTSEQTLNQLPAYKANELTTTAMLDAAPSFTFSQFPSVVKQHVLVSLPTYLRLSRGYASIDDLPYRHVHIKIKSTATSAQISDIKFQINQVLGRYKIAGGIVDLQDTLKSLLQSAAITDFFFMFTVVMTMVMCFFSLTSSMFTNIQEQAKEIGVLRAIGIRLGPVRRMFVYEAFVLVLAASLMGFLIGIVVAYTFFLQQALFTQLPVPFPFPYTLFGVIVISGIVLSIISAYGPVRSLTKQPVVSILRRLLS